MRALSLAEFRAAADDFDRSVMATAAIDRFCSSSHWILPAQAALMPPRRPWLFRGQHGWFAGMLGRHPSGMIYVEPLELAWGLASPLVGADADALAAEFVALCAQRRDWNVLLLAGLAPDGPMLPALLKALPSRWERRLGQSTVRHVASLDGGIDGFLSRRSRNFRKALRQALRTAEADAITFESVKVTTEDDGEALYERILTVERKSWKSREGVGIDAGGMKEFYRLMIRRLAAQGRQRTWFARQAGEDVAYVLGAVFDGEYRGLQFSYDDRLERYSLGTLCQYHQIVELCAEGVTRYDLGSDMEYKRRWAEIPFETTLLIVVAR
jgi:hypothetical protein